MNKTIEAAIPVLREAGREDLADQLNKVDTNVAALAENITLLLNNVGRQHKLMAEVIRAFADKAGKARTYKEIKQLAAQMIAFADQLPKKDKS